MKGPKDKNKNRDKSPDKGGHALERLHQFEKERGFEETDVDHPEVDEPVEEEKEKNGDDSEEK